MTAAKKTAQAAEGGQVPGREAAEMELARQLADRARAEGLALTGPGGLLGRLTKVVLEGAYLIIISLDPTGRGRQRWSNRWKAALNAFDIT